MTTQEIENAARKLVESGAKMTFEQIVAMYTKKEAKKRKSRSSKKWASRKSVAETMEIQEKRMREIKDVDFQNWDEQQRKNQINLLK